jgi:hypothetical protein
MDDFYEDTTHRQDCELRYVPSALAASKGYSCTCEREARIEERRKAGDPVGQ